MAFPGRGSWRPLPARSYPDPEGLSTDDRATQLAAREAFARGEWRTARDRRRAAGQPLTPSELDLLSRATRMLDDIPGSMEQAEQAYASHVRDRQNIDAASLALRLTVAEVCQTRFRE